MDSVMAPPGFSVTAPPIPSQNIGLKLLVNYIIITMEFFQLNNLYIKYKACTYF